MTDTRPEKAGLRRAMRTLRAGITPTQRQSHAQRLAENPPPCLRGAGIVFGYYPMPTEADVLPLLFALDCTVALPVVVEKTLQFYAYVPGDPLVVGALNVMEPAVGQAARAVPDPAVDADVQDVPEPTVDADVPEPVVGTDTQAQKAMAQTANGTPGQEKRTLRSPSLRAVLIPKPGDVVLTPGLAYDAAGHRLGQGCGYYDGFLATLAPGVVTLGIGFEGQLLARVPSSPFDHKVDGVLCGAGGFCLRGGASATPQNAMPLCAASCGGCRFMVK